MNILTGLDKEATSLNIERSQHRWSEAPELMNHAFVVLVDGQRREWGGFDAEAASHQTDAEVQVEVQYHVT